MQMLDGAGNRAEVICLCLPIDLSVVVCFL